MSYKKQANVKHVNSMHSWEVMTEPLCLGLKEGVIVRHVDQSWSFGHCNALRLTRRPVRAVKPLRHIVQCVYPCAATN